jgi:2-dehydro-3-deoxy-D-arabinonate dehydratase
MSSRSIEGENPLYLPQAKVYDGCAALGPRLVLGELPPSETRIGLEIRRADDVVFTGETALDQIKRGFDELVEHLFRDNSFPAGVFVMTGTGIVPGDGFTLAPNDEVAITIEPVGTLTNRVVRS